MTSYSSLRKPGFNLIRNLMFAAALFALPVACVSQDAPSAGATQKSPSPKSSAGVLRATEIAGGLEHPWAMTFLPDGRMLVTERPGRLRIIDAKGKISAPLTGVPQVHARGQGGLLDVILDPRFSENRTRSLARTALPGPRSRAPSSDRRDSRTRRSSLSRNPKSRVTAILALAWSLAATARSSSRWASAWRTRTASMPRISIGALAR
jgi:glucose/arabinose dehydrogenase